MFKWKKVRRGIMEAFWSGYGSWVIMGGFVLMMFMMHRKGGCCGGGHNHDGKGQSKEQADGKKDDKSCH